MKKYIFILFIACIAQFGFTQAPPQGVNYQAVVYSDNGNNQPGLNVPGQVLRNKNIRVRFSIIQNQATGTEVYKEFHTTTTDAFGMFSLVIGGGTQESLNAFSAINWAAGLHFLKVEIDKNGGTNYVTMSNQQLLSVPYALYSDKSTYANTAGNGITSVSDNGNGSLTFTYTDGSTYTTPILTGIQGPQGATGPQGPAGQNGLSAYEIWLAQGNTGTEQDFLTAIKGDQGETGTGLNILNTFNSESELPSTGNPGDAYLINGDLFVWSQNSNSWNNAGNVQGPQGIPGLSSYELWLNQGNSGTIQDYLVSLTGPQGLQGIQGIQGPQGETGAGLNILNTFSNESQLPTSGNAGDAYLVNGNLFVWSVNNNSWNNAGNVQGPQGQTGLSAYQIWLSQGNNGTEQDFLNAITGPQGVVGASGVNGKNTLVRTSNENAGSNCATGGIKLEYGLDNNNNGSLDASEINASLTKYVCNGAVGATGANGIQGVAGANGTNGRNTLVRTTTESAGANCSTGGIKIEYGLDANGNGTLDVSEINASLTKYVCNGAVGATGATGPQGPQGIQGTPGSQNAWSLTGSSGTNPSTNFIGTTDAQDFAFKTNNVERLRMTSNGNLGIGVSSPFAPLTVRSTSNTTNSIVSDLGNSIFEGGFRLVSMKGVTSNNPGDAVLKFGVVYGTSSVTNSSLIRFHRGSAANDGSISFSTNDDAVEIMRLANISNVGRVGIGTSNPTATLDLNGSLKIVNGTQGAGKVLTSDASGNATWQSPSGGSNRVVSGTTTAGFAPSTINGTGFTVSRVNTGNYLVTFSTPFSTPPSVNATVYLSSGTFLFELQIVKVSGVTVNGFNVHTLNFTGGTSMNVIDYLPFSFVAVGN